MLLLRFSEIFLHTHNIRATAVDEIFNAVLLLVLVCVKYLVSELEHCAQSPQWREKKSSLIGQPGDTVRWFSGIRMTLSVSQVANVMMWGTKLMLYRDGSLLRTFKYFSYISVEYSVESLICEEESLALVFFLINLDFFSMCRDP